VGVAKLSSINATGPEFRKWCPEIIAMSVLVLSSTAADYAFRSIHPKNLDWLWITEVMMVDSGLGFSYSCLQAPRHLKELLSQTRIPSLDAGLLS
jgi:hypothetical protein